jgi:hypothetical protein
MERLRRELDELAEREAAGRAAGEERMYRLHVSVSHLQDQVEAIQEKLRGIEQVSASLSTTTTTEKHGSIVLRSGVEGKIGLVVSRHTQNVASITIRLAWRETSRRVRRARNATAGSSTPAAAADQRGATTTDDISKGMVGLCATESSL